MIVDELVLALRLRWPHLRPMVISQGSVGLKVIEREKPQVVFLCEDLPDMTILSGIREIRRFSDVPIVVTTNGTSDLALFEALQLGADDYIRLPCPPTEVMARVVALLRRVNLIKHQGEDGPIRCGDLLLNPAAHEVFLGSTPLSLTAKEFKLLHLLARHRHMILSQEFIRRSVWADEAEASRTLKMYIQRLRRKLGDNPRDATWIKTVRGVGYRFTPPVTPRSSMQMD